MLGRSLSEELFLNIQSELPPTQLDAIPLHSITIQQREEISTAVSTHPHEEAVDSNVYIQHSFIRL